MLGSVQLVRAVGCMLATLCVGDEVTFTRDVAPILFENCTECHRSGQAAPFPLASYADARKRARMIALVTESRLMPPWPPVEGHGDFVGARHLDAGEIETLRAWAEQGGPEGDPRALPPLPEFSDGWKLGPPDLIVQMPRGYEVPADSQDIYRVFPLHTQLEEEKWLTAVEVRPGPSGVLHHLRVGYDATLEAREIELLDGEPGFEAMDGSTEMRFGLGSYVVGSAPFVWPDGLSQRIPAGADIVLNSHLHPVGKPAVESTTIGLHFADTPPTRTVLRLSLPPVSGAFAGIDIPAGERDYRLKDSFELPVDASIVIVLPHAHYLCREARLDAFLPDGEQQPLLYIDDWRFEWQGSYRYVEPVELPAGTRIEAELIYDNSSDNPANPFDPPQRVRWGLQSTDEMGTIGLAMVSKARADRRKLAKAILDYSQSRARRAGDPEQRKQRMAIWRMRLFDLDDDGRLTQAEVPDTYEARFASLDKNGDGVLDEAELELPE